MLMKALSVRPPWSWALLHGKPIENRGWTTSFRGWCLIHAAKTWDQDGYDWIARNRDRLGLTAQPPNPRAFRCGGIIGAAELVSCVRRHTSPWFFGPCGFLFKHAREVRFHPCRGELGFFEVDYPYELQAGSVKEFDK